MMASVLAGSPETRTSGRPCLLPLQITRVGKLASCPWPPPTKKDSTSSQDLLKLFERIRTQSIHANSYPPILKNTDPVLPTSASTTSLPRSPLTKFNPNAFEATPEAPLTRTKSDPPDPHHLAPPAVWTAKPRSPGLDYNGKTRITSSEQPAAAKPALKFTRSNSLPAKKRSVVFADSIGKPLEHVKMITEKRDDPPKFLFKSYYELQESNSSKGSSGYGSDGSQSPDEGEFYLEDERERQLIKLIASLKTPKNGANKDAPKRNQSYPIDITRTLPQATSSPVTSHTTESRLSSYISRNKFTPCFSQPAMNSSHLMNTLLSQNITLERATLFGNRLRGTVLCKNIDYCKQVTVKFTCDNWQSFTECKARWRRSNLDCSHDIFEFDTIIPELPQGPATVVFCLRYNTSSAEYWDSNGSKNYMFQKFN